jgi:hypothetical protein
MMTESTEGKKRASGIGRDLKEGASLAQKICPKGKGGKEETSD